MRGVPLALAAAAAAVAVAGIVTAVQITVLTSLDETVYKLSAVSYASDPGTLFTDPIARGTARLYSLLIAPLFAVLEGDQAVRAARGLNAVLWALTAAPLYLLARRVIASPRRAAAAAFLSIAVPWVTLSTILFSEALSYLLFAVTVVAMLRALEAPSRGRDAVVLVLLAVLVTARMQFVVLPVAWVLVVAWVELRNGGGPRAAARRAAAGHPFLVALVAVGIVALLVLAATDVLRAQIDRFGGPYSDLQNRSSLPRDAGLAVLTQAELLALGVGLVPAVLGATWLGRALAGRVSPDAFRFALLWGALLAVLFATTVWAQGGWLDTRTEERYYIYAVPLVWIAALAALDLPHLTSGRLLAGGSALALVAFLAPVTVLPTGEQMFLGPVGGTIADVAPDVDSRIRESLGVDFAVSQRDLVGWVAVAVAVASALLWRRSRALALVPALALQAAITVYVLLAVFGRIDGVPGVVTGTKFAALGWVDRAAPGGAEAVQAENGAEGREADALNTAFWNDDVRSRLTLTDAASFEPPFPANALPRAVATPRDDLALGLTLPSRYVIANALSPRWQVDGRRLGRGPDGRLELVDAGETPRLRWLATGLDPDGHAVRPVALTVPAGRRVEIAVDPPAGTAPASARFRLGEESAVFDSAAATGTQTITLATCGATGPVRGSIDILAADARVGADRFSAALLRSVKVTPC